MARAQAEPEVGSWYRDLQNRLFEVVAYDDEDTIEVQYFDGDVSELDRESWEILSVVKVLEPGDGLGMYEDMDEEGFYETDSEMLHTVSWESVIADEGEL